MEKAVIQSFITAYPPDVATLLVGGRKVDLSLVLLTTTVLVCYVNIPTATIW